MERQRREFLRTMSTAAALPVLAPILKQRLKPGRRRIPLLSLPQPRGASERISRC